MSVVSRNFHNLRGRIHGPDGGFICCCSLSVFFFFFFLEPLKLLKVEGLREGRMTVNQDPALSPGKVEGNTFERGNTIRDNNHCLKIYFKQ